MLSKIQWFSFKKMHLYMSSAKLQPFCLGLNVLTINMQAWFRENDMSWQNTSLFYVIFPVNIVGTYTTNRSFVRLARALSYFGTKGFYPYPPHYNDVIMGEIASQITSLTIVFSTVYSDADKKNPSQLRVTGLCAGNSPGPVNSPHKWPVTRKMFPFSDVIMLCHFIATGPPK